MIIGSKKNQITLINIVINRIIIMKIDVLNISLDAKDVTQINKTSIPPKKIRNRMYENQNDKLDNPVVLQIKIVWKRSPRPIARG